jgi:hypothetical protein
VFYDLAKGHNQKQVEWVVKVLDGYLDKTVEVLTIELESELHKSTPKDTGYARSNWIASIDVPTTAPIGSKLAVSEGSGPAAAIKAGTSFDSKKHKRIYLSNHVEYIGTLNDRGTENGPSGVPAGFVQRSITKTVRSTANAMRRYKTMKAPSFK